MNRGETDLLAHPGRHNGERGICASQSEAHGRYLKHTQYKKTELLLGQSIQLNRCDRECESKSETLKSGVFLVFSLSAWRVLLLFQLLLCLLSSFDSQKENY